MENQPQTTSDDRLWAALGYPIPIVALVLLFMEEKKDIPFLRFHAVQSIALNIAIWVLIIVLVAITFGVAGICAPLVWFVTLWPAVTTQASESKVMGYWLHLILLMA